MFLRTQFLRITLLSIKVNQHIGIIGTPHGAPRLGALTPPSVLLTSSSLILGLARVIGDQYTTPDTLVNIALPLSFLVLSSFSFNLE